MASMIETKQIKLITIAVDDPSLLIAEEKTGQTIRTLLLKNYSNIPFFSRYINYTVKVKKTNHPLVKTQKLAVISNMRIDYTAHFTALDIVNFNCYSIVGLVKMDLVTDQLVTFDTLLELCDEYIHFEEPWEKKGLLEWINKKYSGMPDQTKKFKHGYNIHKNLEKSVYNFHFKYPTILDQYECLKTWFGNVRFGIETQEEKRTYSNLNGKQFIRIVFGICLKNPLWLVSFADKFSRHNCVNQYLDLQRTKLSGTQNTTKSRTVSLYRTYPFFQDKSKFIESLTTMQKFQIISKRQSEIYEIAYNVGNEISYSILKLKKRETCNSMSFHIESILANLKQIPQSSVHVLRLISLIESLDYITKYKIHLLLTTPNSYIDKNCNISSFNDENIFSPLIYNGVSYKLREQFICESYMNTKFLEMMVETSKNNSNDSTSTIFDYYDITDYQCSILPKILQDYKNRQLAIIVPNKISMLQVQKVTKSVQVINIHKIVSSNDSSKIGVITANVLVFWQFSAFNAVMLLKAMLLFNKIIKIVVLSDSNYPRFPGFANPDLEIRYLEKTASLSFFKFIDLKNQEVVGQYLEIKKEEELESGNSKSKTNILKFKKCADFESDWEITCVKNALKKSFITLPKITTISINKDTTHNLNQKIAAIFMNRHFGITATENYKNSVPESILFRGKRVLIDSIKKNSENHKNQPITLSLGTIYTIKKLFFFNSETKVRPSIDIVDIENNQYFKSQWFKMDNEFLEKHCLVLKFEEDKVELAIDILRIDERTKLFQIQKLSSAWALTMNQSKDMVFGSVYLYIPEDLKDLEKLPTEIYKNMANRSLSETVIFTKNGTEDDLPKNYQKSNSPETIFQKYESTKMFDSLIKNS